MTARSNIGASFESAEAVGDQEYQDKELNLTEIANRLREVGKTVEDYAYQAAGQISADVIAELIIVAAELDRLSGRLQH